MGGHIGVRVYGGWGPGRPLDCPRVLFKLKRHPLKKTSPVPANGSCLAGLSGGVAVPLRVTGYCVEAGTS
jgi:hypothetical protein